MLTSSYWVYVSMNTYGNAPPWLASILTLIFCCFISALLIPFFVIYKKIKPNNALLNSLLFASIWTLCEWFRSWFLTGFPWAYIGYSQIDGPLAHYAPILSVYGLSFLLAFISSQLVTLLQFCFAASFKAQPKIIALQLISITLIFFAAPLLPISLWTHNSASEPIAVSLVQPNTNLHYKWKRAFREPIKQQLLNLSQIEQQPHRLIVWPETAIPQYYHAALDDLQQWSKQLSDAQQALITGIPSAWYQDDNKVYHNSMLGLGYASGIYHKHKLVPFGEFIPLESVLRGAIDFFDLPMSAFRPGPLNQDMLRVEIAGQLFHTLPMICYEIVYPEFVAQRAAKQDFLLTVSNDAWFGQSIGPVQHLEMARMRALENGRYLVRSTNNGITAIIGPDGKVLQRLKAFAAGVLDGEIYPRQGYTPVAQYGTIPSIIFSCFWLLLCLAISLHQRSV
ncbi:MAG: apolipoprotein N-acyltransferase [Pseudomonadales bacterium]|nr:apolipoprotein N-acyltransferase [Pseudomonadales bacterium]